MRDLLKSLTCALALGLVAAPVVAQDTTAPAAEPATTTTETTAPAAPTEGTTPVDPTISMGTPVAEESNIGQPYTRDTFGDWTLNCVHAPEGQKDPCAMFQKLFDDKGNPVAEVTIFYLISEKGELAAATFATPLDTLLSQQLRLVVDENAEQRYPFTFCNKSGCYSRVGFNADQINSFKRGSKGTVTIVPLAAPDTMVGLNMSLKGFTAAFDALVADARS